MRKIAAFISILCVLNLVALVGLLAYLYGTGRLDSSKAQAITDLLRHKGTPDKLREGVADLLDPPPPATAPATAPATRPAGEGAIAGGPATAEERIEFARQAMEQERLRLENEAQDLRHRQELLEQVQAKVEAQRKKNEEERKAVESAATQAASTSGEEAFQKSLALYNELKPKQIKDLFMPLQPDLVARYLQAMPPDQAAKIVAEFKAPGEKEFIGRVLERIRSAGTGAASGARTQAN